MLGPVSDFIDGALNEIIARSAYADVFHNMRYPAKDWDRFKAIREFYFLSDSGLLDWRDFDWREIMTPIEVSVWDDMRASGLLSMRPQYPIGNRFADFADPQSRIIVECDGVAFHNRDDDQVRDQALREEGWTVFRLPGCECVRVIDVDWDDEAYSSSESGAPSRRAVDWLLDTSSGLISAIAWYYYGVSTPAKFSVSRIQSTLKKHSSIGAPFHAGIGRYCASREMEAA